MNFVTKPLVLLTGLLLAALLSGCSFSFSAGSGQSPTEGVTEQIEAAYERQAGLAMRTLECEEVEVENKAAITCRGRNAAGVDLLIGGEVNNVEGSEFDYNWDVTRAVAPGDLYAKEAVGVVERLSGGPVAGVRCQKRVPVEVGTYVSCEVKAANGELTPIQLRLTDSDGGFEVVTGGAPGAGGSGDETAGA